MKDKFTPYIVIGILAVISYLGFNIYISSGHSMTPIQKATFWRYHESADYLFIGTTFMFVARDVAMKKWRKSLVQLLGILCIISACTNIWHFLPVEYVSLTYQLHSGWLTFLWELLLAVFIVSIIRLFRKEKVA